MILLMQRSKTENLNYEEKRPVVAFEGCCIGERLTGKDPVVASKVVIMFYSLIELYVSAKIHKRHVKFYAFHWMILRQ